MSGNMDNTYWNLILLLNLRKDDETSDISLGKKEQGKMMKLVWDHECLL